MITCKNCTKKIDMSVAEVVDVVKGARIVRCPSCLTLNAAIKLVNPVRGKPKHMSKKARIKARREKHG